jgi:chemotaxis protein methyltransferase CheR
MAIADAALTLSDRELGAVIRLVYERSGITLHDGKRALVVSRLQKRLRAGGFHSFTDYLRFVEADQGGQELVALLDAIATNHTSFFREPQHFAYLVERVLPAWQERGGGRPLEVWSAACSTGEEPYTLAMVLRDHRPELGDPARCRILASDLSTKALARAAAAVYPVEKVQGLGRDLLRRHFERGLGAQSGLVRVAAGVRRLVSFTRRNLLDDRDMSRRFDAIFCRNVMIYFDKAVQQRVVSMLERHLAPSGVLVISHSESLNGLSHGLKWVAPAVYARRAG